MTHFEPLESRRLFAAGNLDPSFGTAGIVQRTGGADVNTQATDLDVAPTGDIVLTTLLEKQNTSGLTVSATISLWRMHTDGSALGIFGSAEQVLIPLPDDVAHVNGFTSFDPRDPHTVLTPDGGALVSDGYRLYKITSRGKFDRTFAHGGRAAFTDFVAASDMSVDIDSLGRIYVAGQKTNHNPAGDLPVHTLLFRLNPDGSIDHTFADHGVFVPPISTYDPIFDVKVLSGGKIMFTGNAGPDAVSMRLNSDGSIDTSYATAGIFSDDYQDDDIDYRLLDNRGIAADGSVMFTLNFTFDDTVHSRGWDSVDPDGHLLQTQPDMSLIDTDGPLIRDKNGVIALAEDSPAFYDPTTLQPRQAVTDAAAAATAHTSDDGAPDVDAIASDGSLLIVNASGGVIPGRDGNTLNIRRLFTEDGPAAEARATVLRSSGPGSYRFKVSYHDTSPIDPSTLGDNDISVTLPNGQHRSARLLRANLVDGSTTDYLAYYLLTAPDGSWDTADNGPYTIRINRGAVSDTDGHTTAQRNIGVFYVNVAN